jgi:hypothetical protein
MTAYKTKDICSALKKKGFSETPKNRHTHYILYENGKKTEIFTFISRGIAEYNDNLLGSMKKQLHLESKTELKNFIECPMAKEQYRDLLIERGCIE